jgi:hypothetical protein
MNIRHQDTKTPREPGNAQGKNRLVLVEPSNDFLGVLVPWWRRKGDVLGL